MQDAGLAEMWMQDWTGWDGMEEWTDWMFIAQENDSQRVQLGGITRFMSLPSGTFGTTSSVPLSPLSTIP
jgi:hypothetical protein